MQKAARQRGLTSNATYNRRKPMTPTTELEARKRPEIKTALPGPKSLEIINADAEFVTPSYPRPDYKLVADHAQGVWITDPDGNVFLDCKPA